MQLNQATLGSRIHDENQVYFGYAVRPDPGGDRALLV